MEPFRLSLNVSKWKHSILSMLQSWKFYEIKKLHTAEEIKLYNVSFHSDLVHIIAFFVKLNDFV